VWEMRCCEDCGPKVTAFWETTVYSLVGGYENVGRQDPEDLSLEGCFSFKKERKFLINLADSHE
jgi:hypothetical protein